MTQSTDVSLLDSVANAELGRIGKEVARFTLDQVLDDEIVAAVPVVGLIARSVKSIASIRDRLFLLKVLSFLEELEGVPRESRQRFAEELSRSAGTSARAGAAIALALERLDDLEKPKIIGRLYRAKIDDRITFDQLWRFCMIVDRAHLPDLIELTRLKSRDHVDPIAANYLQALGIVTLTGENWGTIDGVGADQWFELNELGRLFLTAAFASW